MTVAEQGRQRCPVDPLPTGRPKPHVASGVNSSSVDRTLRARHRPPSVDVRAAELSAIAGLNGGCSLAWSGAGWPHCVNELTVPGVKSQRWHMSKNAPNPWPRRFTVIALLAALAATGGLSTREPERVPSLGDGIPRCC